jgi:hypothetical protein
VANNSFSTNVQELTTQLSRPSVDAIEEFKVVTSPYAAEYGWSPGAAIIVSTKAGSNTLRGTGYDFFRNDSLDTINYFAKKAKQPKPTNSQNQFGGNLGSPILKNRLFFFGDVEATRIKQGVLRTGRVLTPAERQGVFSTTIRDPLTGQPFNNTIPANRIDPSRQIVSMLPKPDAWGTTTIRQPGSRTSRNAIARVDTLGSTTSSRYICSDRFGASRLPRRHPRRHVDLGDGAATSARTRSSQAGRSSARRSSTRRASRTAAPTTADPFGEDGNAQIGFKGVPADDRVVGGIVGMDVSGHIRLGSPNFMPKFQHTEQMQFLNTLTWLKGRHQVKFGVDVMAPMNNEYFDVAPTSGNLEFNGQFNGSGLADFMLCYAQRAQLTNVFVVEQQLQSYGAYIQDDWKVGDALTVNIGVARLHDAGHREEQPDGELRPGHAGLVFASDGSIEDRALVNPIATTSRRASARQCAGRDHPAWRLGSSTTSSTAWGRDQLALNRPASPTSTCRRPAAAVPILRLQDGFPPTSSTRTTSTSRASLIRAADANRRTEVRQFGGGIEQQLGASFVASIDFVGSSTRNLGAAQPQPAAAGTLDANGPLPYPTFGNIQWREMTEDGQLQGPRRLVRAPFQRRLTATGRRTVGRRATRREHLNAASGRPQNGRDLESWEGPSDFDIRHRVSANVIAELPFGEGKPRLKDGFAVTCSADGSSAAS